MTNTAYLRSQWRAWLPGFIALLLLGTFVLLVPRQHNTSQLSGQGSSDGLSQSGTTGGDSGMPPGGGATPTPTAASQQVGGQPGGVLGTTTGRVPVGPPSPYQGTNGGATYPGVTATSVKLGFAWQESGCGGSDSTAVRQGLGINTDWGQLFKDAVKLFNEHPAIALGLTPAQAKALGPKGYYGRTVAPTVYDSHGNACQDAGRAMAVKAVEQDHIFGMVQNGTEGSEPWISQEVTARRRIHIGSANTTAAYYKQRSPYAWDGRWGEGDKAMVATASWACRDLVGKAVSSPNDPLINGKTRKFGLIRFDTPVDAEIARALKAELARCGATLTDDIAESTDSATAQQQGPQTLARLHQDGVSSVFVGVDWINMTTLTQTATKQAYFPEWLVSSNQQADWPARIWYFWDQQQRALAKGTTYLYSEHQLQDTQTYEYKMWHVAHPESDTPSTDWKETLYQVRVFFRGLYGAGPNLTADTWVQGLGTFCDPCARTDPLQPLELQKVGDYSNWADFGIVTWDPNRTDPSEFDGVQNGYRKGFWHFLDGGRRYRGTVRTPSTFVSG